MSKEVKEGSWESRGAQKHENSVVCEISQPKIAPCKIATSLRNYFAAPRSRCENAILLRNDFAAPWPPLRKFSQLRRGPLAHECHFASSYTRFAAAKPPRLELLHFAAELPFWRVFRSCETTLWHMSAISQPSTLILQLRNGCETSKRWNPPFRSRDAIWKGASQLRNHPLAQECHFKASYTHFAAAKWLQNLHILKSFSAHTMSWHVAAVPPFWQLLDTFRSFPKVHFMHTIFHFKSREFRSS